MPNKTCNKDHSSIIGELENLDISQAVIRGRHRCAGCAYEAGYSDGYLDGWKSAGGTGTPPPPPPPHKTV